MRTAVSFWQMTVGIFVETGVRYFLFASVAWVLAYLVFKRRWQHRKINPSAPAKSDVWRELRYSFFTLIVFGAVGTATIWAGKYGYTRMYFGLTQHSWGWFFASIVLTIFLHDAYFYWTHRLMHHPRLFRIVHHTHHRSVNPTPWAAYSFSPWEAVVQAGIFPLAVTVMPIHPLAFFLFMVWQITFNVMGHTGFEFHPRWLMNTFLGKIMNTPTNHVMHHEVFRANYGLYFNIWDRLMGTNHADYEKRFHDVTSRPVAQEPTVAAIPVSAK
jgi:sterol desaturase/sphingolipid hydroxylase (fatty acid hydroxylase superfamily)